MSVDADDEPAGGSLTHRIVTKLTERTGADHTDLPPLAESVDPDALHRIVAGNARSDVQITFRHTGFLITVDSAGDIDIRQEE